MAAALDDSVGEVARALRNSGQMDNTIIVFTTDNGGPANGYDGNAACNYPLRYSVKILTKLFAIALHMSVGRSVCPSVGLSVDKPCPFNN